MFRSFIQKFLAIVILTTSLSLPWHTTKKLRLPGNISLLPLPAASPELNPTEQVWQVLRDRYLGNRCFDSYEHILDSCCDAWNAFCSTVGAVRQLCMREWAKTKSYF